MSSMTLKSLTEKLNPSTRNALQQAVALCCQQRHYDVDIEHLMISLVEQQDPDLLLIADYFRLDQAVLNDQLRRVLANCKRGNDSTPALSTRLVELLKQCWLDTSIEFNQTSMCSATLLYSLLTDATSNLLTTRFVPELGKIDPLQLRQDWAELRQQKQESEPARPSQTPALNQYTLDLTQQAKEGKLDPVLGRDNEIRQLIDILSRRRQNNPILVGEAGVGKTAIAEGLALRIASQEVPDTLKQTRLHTLDLALLQAGAGVKGEFEHRLKGLIDEIKKSPIPIILFIDEAHTMIGAGGQPGQNDAANLLKPALARGELRTIAATTWSEYKKYFEKDAALSRRFQPVSVDEPNIDTAIAILRALKPALENHHGVSVTESALQAAVRLSQRYMPDRQLPDKCVSLLDTACARVAMSQSSQPAAIERLHNLILLREQELANLDSEQLSGVDHLVRQQEVLQTIDTLQTQLHQLQGAWATEQQRVTDALSLQEQLRKDYQSESADHSDGSYNHQANQSRLSHELNALRLQLEERESPLVHWQVDDQLVAEILADWTGIPLKRMQADDITQLLSLEQRLQQRVIGQDHAIQKIAEAIRTSRARISDDSKPLGVFLLAGPSGVGKTETALALAEQIFGSEDSLTVINMSEFKEEHKVSQLTGAPAGYVGYGEGGILTNAVRRKPYSVILLDEMEKAHPGVQDIFYQVFDKGSLRDGEGLEVDFKNTVILITSNAAGDLITDLYADELTAPATEKLSEIIWDELLKFFKPAFLGRMTVLPYRPLDLERINSITRLQLNKIQQRISKNYNADLTYDNDVVASIVELCRQGSSGARNIQILLETNILPNLANTILNRIATKAPINSISIHIDAGKIHTCVN